MENKNTVEYQYLSEAYKKKPGEYESFYDKWASNYDDVAGGNCQYHLIVEYAAEVFKKYVNPVENILDIACGTGLSGLALKKCGFKNIDGVDPSGKSILVAKEKGAYQKLTQGEITDIKNLDVPDNSYGAAFVIGAMSKNQLLPLNCLKECFRIIKPGGYCVCTISDPENVFGFMEIFGQGMKDGVCQVISLEERFYFHYVPEDITFKCHVCVFKIL